MQERTNMTSDQLTSEGRGHFFSTVSPYFFFNNTNRTVLDIVDSKRNTIGLVLLRPIKKEIGFFVVEQVHFWKENQSLPQAKLKQMRKLWRLGRFLWPFSKRLSLFLVSRL